MADKSMHHYAMEDNVNGASGGQFVVTVGSDGKLMQVRDPLFMPSSSGVPTLAGGKREEMNPNINASSSKNDVYQYVVNAASSSGQYMGLMAMGPDGKLAPVRNDRNAIPHQAPSAAVIDFNASKDPKAVLLQIHPSQSHHSVQDSHSQVQKHHQEHQHRNDRGISHQPAAVIDFNNGKDPKSVLLHIHPSHSQLPHQSAQESHNVHHAQVAQQQHQQQQQGNIPHQLQQGNQQQTQPHEQRQPLQQQQRRQSHQQVLRTDKIVKGDREVVCAKSCRACCKFDEEEPPDVNSYVQQTMKSVSQEDSATTTPTSWASENSSSFSPGGVSATSPNGSSKAARFQCKVCMKMFTQKVNLTAHERIHLGERPYQCKTCLKSFTQQSNLVTHERIHTGERPYQCQVCMKRFTQRQNLTAHERIHLGERPFTCQVCNKSFTQSQNLTAHERIHLGERPFQCQVCLKTFTQQQNLNSHERIHHMERQFTCNVCLRVFSQETSLQRHMQTHTGERPYTCQVCHRSFAQQSSLLVHEWVHKSPERRKRNYPYANVEENVLEIQSSEQDHHSNEESLQERKHNVDQDEGEKGQQVQCLT
ncbi:zinc finger protein 260-like isoform X2 [Thrips palmi]|uniref:Zinc finger protein 260-like isoform X2 n=1 Tax=Thrips palmi TaxID=161013 RepID=A0A6P8ZLZ0_THRPL|nr:zinc finger protein 260-like isoform X2 [Thrips palmi]